MKTIIVASDFSFEAENALEYAAALAKDLNVQIIIFNSYNVPIHVANSLLPAQALKEVSRQNDILLEKRAKELAEKYQIEVGFESGLLLRVSEQLKALFDKYDASLIVMGMAESSFAQDIFGNTTTASIMAHTYPVLAIPVDMKYAGIKKVLFATDELGGMQKSVLERIKSLASGLDAEVEIFRVQESVKKLREMNSEETISELNEKLEGLKLYYKNVESDAVINEIENRIREITADLLIMIPHQYGFWRSMIHRSKTRKMASRCEIPLLSLPQIKE